MDAIETATRQLGVTVEVIGVEQAECIPEILRTRPVRLEHVTGSASDSELGMSVIQAARTGSRLNLASTPHHTAARYKLATTGIRVKLQPWKSWP